jgi:hypothetical protein
MVTRTNYDLQNTTQTTDNTMVKTTDNTMVTRTNYDLQNTNSNMMGITGGAGTIYPSDAPDFILSFHEVRFVLLLFV